MNTNEFYKELFERYALDQESIRLEALKQARTPAWKRAAEAYWKPAAGIAAAVAVTVGAVAYTATGSSDLNITVSPEMAVSASQRLYDAEQSYYNASVEEMTRVNVYVTFIEPTSYADMSIAVSAVPDSEDIEVDALYLTDGTVLREREDIELFAELSGSDKDIAAAKLIAHASQYRDINDLSSVYLAELGSEKINDSTFVPMDVDDSDPLNSDISYVTESTAAVETPAVSTTAFSFEQETSAVTTEIKTEATTAVSTEDTAAETTIAPAEDVTEEITTAPETGIGEDISDDTTVPAETSDESEDNPAEETADTEIYETDVPEVGETEYSEETAVSETEPAETTTSAAETDNTHVIGLMTEVYKLDIPDSLETVLVGNRAVVLTKNEVYVCTIGGINEDVQKFELSNPKVAYASNKTVIISGCGSENQRNRMVVLNPVNGCVCLSDISANIGNSEIGTINYSPACGKFFLKTISSSATYIYELSVDDTANVSFRPLFELGAAVSLVGYGNGNLYFTASESYASCNLYAFDCVNGTTAPIATFDTACKSKRGPNFDCFTIVAADGTFAYVFDIANGKLIPVDITADTAVTTYGGSVYFNMNDEIFTLDGSGNLVPSSGYGAVFRNGITSELVISETNSENVVIAKKDNARWA